MDDAVKAWLFDISNAIEEIDSFFVGIPKDFYQYQQDLKTKRAVERKSSITNCASSFRYISQCSLIRC